MSKSQNLATILKRHETSYGTLIQVLLAHHTTQNILIIYTKIIIFTTILIIFKKNHHHIHKHPHNQQKHPLYYKKNETQYFQKHPFNFTNILLTSQTSTFFTQTSTFFTHTTTFSLQTSPLTSQASLSFHFFSLRHLSGLSGGAPSWPESWILFSLTPSTHLLIERFEDFLIFIQHQMPPGCLCNVLHVPWPGSACPGQGS